MPPHDSLSPAKLAGWRFDGKSAANFHYLNTSGCTATPEHDDAKEFAALTGALDAMGASSATQHELFSCLAACLHLGNIEFHSPPTSPEAGAGGVKPPAVTITEGGSLEAAAALFGLTCEALQAALTTRTNKMQRGSEVETFTVRISMSMPMPIEEARDVHGCAWLVM